MSKSEKKFYETLSDVFVGIDVKDKYRRESGFITLMQIKSDYYREIEKVLKKDVDKALEKYPKFREELFNKLYNFFQRYFSQNGSIHFNDTPFHNDTYEKVYTNKNDVALFWKTKMLYYVKTDVIYKDIVFPIGEYEFAFSCNELDNKKANEKQKLIFELSEVSNQTINLNVKNSKHGTKTKSDDILKSLKIQGVKISEEELVKACQLFKRQSEIDYFINKDAASFLKEQFKLWSYQYFWIGAKEWTSERVDELQILKEITFKIIDFIGDFENELVSIWNKPKFVRKSNYVITLDRLSSELVDIIRESKGYKAQREEWEKLNIDESNPKAPIDTKHFKDLELDILGEFDDLDAALDGWLIKSENYQALNTMLPKFREKVQCVYIDPPFNTGDDFEYMDKFQESTWLSLMNDRLSLAQEFLNVKGSMYLHLDHIADYLGRMLMIKTFHNSGVGDQAFITWNTGDNISGFKTQRENWIRQADKILFFPKDASQASFYKLWNPMEKDKSDKYNQIGWLDFIGKDKNNLYIEKWIDGEFNQEPISFNAKRMGTIWNDIYSFQYSEPRETESFSFKTQKPENLIRRIIQSCTKKGEIVLDSFSGIGTTAAVAHKLNRKWLAIELGEHFHNFYHDRDGQEKVGILGRMKLVLKGDVIFNLPNTDQARKPHLSRDVGWEGGGFFKYYELEQYEEALKNTKYSKSNSLFQQTDGSPYEQYAFLADEKMLRCLEIDEKGNKVKVDLSELYQDIDIAETLSNLLGKSIKKISKEEVVFSDNEKININDLDHKLIKRLIWWRSE